MRNDDSNSGATFNDVVFSSCPPVPVDTRARHRIVLPAWAAKAAKARVVRGQYGSLEELFSWAITQHLIELANQDDEDALYARRMFGDEPLFSPVVELVRHVGVPQGPGLDRALPSDGPDECPPFPATTTESAAAAEAAEQTVEDWVEELFGLEKERQLADDPTLVSHAKSGWER